VYVDLVDFTLRERVDDFINALEGDLAVGWHLLSWYRGSGARKAQDRYVQTLFERHGTQLKALAPPSTSFRVISARRVLAIMSQNPRRVPGLGIPAAGTGVFNAEVNVHISVRDETQPWDDIAEQCRRTASSMSLIRSREQLWQRSPRPCFNPGRSPRHTSASPRSCREVIDEVVA
jgi:hypothetical protein